MTIYSTGTVSVTNGNAVVTGSGTAWAVALIAGGMFSSAGVSVPIASVDSDTSLTLAYDWPGTIAAGAVYAIARENSEAADIVNLNDRLSQVLVKLSLIGIHPDNSGSLAKRNALTLGTSDDNYIFLRAELGVEFAFYRWDGPSLAWIGPFTVADAVASGGVTSIVAGGGIAVDATNPAIPIVSLDVGASLGADYMASYTGNLGLTTASLQSPLTTNAAFYLHGTTTTTNQNFLSQYELISDTVSNGLGGAVALDWHVEATANSGGVWAGAGTVQLDTGFAFGTYSAFIQEFGINNLAGEYSDIGASASIGVSLNGLGYRNSAALYINNMQQYIVATSATVAGSAVLTFSGGVPAWFKVGGVITNLTNPSVIPAGTTMLSKTATTITLSANVTGAGIAINDHIQIAQPLWYQGIKFAAYSVAQHSINDQSNSATSLNIAGAHTFGIDFTSATLSSAAIRLGVGSTQGITARFSGTDYSLIYADAAGRGVIGNTTLGTRFNGTVGIGQNPDPAFGLVMGGSVSNAAGNAYGINLAPTLAPASGAAAVFNQTGGTVNTGASNALAGAYSCYLAAPVKTGGGSIGTSYSLFLESPTSGAANYSLYSAGFARFAAGVQIDGYLARSAPVVKTADFAVAATETWLICNKGSTLTVTLPAAASFVGREITIKTIQAFTVVSASSNVIPLAGGAAGTAILAATAGKWATLVSDGTSWNIMTGN